MIGICEVEVNVSELIQIDEFQLINPIQTDKQIKGCYVSDLLSWVMGHAKSGECWVTIMSHLNIVAVASLLDLSCIIIAENEMPDEETIQKANENDVILISAKCTSFEAIRLLIRNGMQ
jgi:hypothetical protein